MPTAPVYGNQNAQSRVVPGVFKQPNRTAADYGATDALGKMAQVAENVYIQESAQRASKASTIAAARKQEALTKVKSEYRGERAIEGETVYKQMAQQIDDEYRGDLQSNPYALNKYNESAQVTDASMSGHVTGWMLTERDQAANATDEAAFKRSVTEAANIAPLAVGSPDMQAKYNDALLSAQESQANRLRRAGAPEDAIKQANAQLQGQVNAQVVDIFLEINDTRKADTWFKATSHTMDPAKRADLQGKLQKSQDIDISSAVAMSAVQDAIKANPLSPDLMKATQAIMASDSLTGKQKYDALQKADTTVSNYMRQVDANSHATYLSGSKLADGIRRQFPDKDPRLVSEWDSWMSDPKNYTAYNNMREKDREALKDSFLNPPVVKTSASAVQALFATPAGATLDAVALQMLTPNDRRIVMAHHAEKSDAATAKQENEKVSFINETLEHYSALNHGGEKDKELELKAVALDHIKNNPELYKMLKQEPKAWKKFYDDVKAEVGLKIPYVGLSASRSADNLNIVTKAAAEGSVKDKQAIGDEILSWGVAYKSNKTRDELVTAPMKVLAASYTPRPESPIAKVEGDRWEAWQKLALQSIGGPTKDVMLVDRRAYNLMMEDMKKADAIYATDAAGPIGRFVDWMNGKGEQVAAPTSKQPAYLLGGEQRAREMAKTDEYVIEFFKRAAKSTKDFAVGPGMMQIGQKK